MNRKQLIKNYVEFFKSKKHKEIDNASLIPEHDPTVLFTTAGMHPLVPYLLGQKHPQGKRLVNVQKCIRTQDINGVGDEVHHTFFEMLGNWSLGDYWKKEAIEMSFEFLTKVLKIPIQKLSVSCFKGNKNASKDIGSAKVWESLGIKKNKIKFLGERENWWGPAGKTGPCGPDTEMFVDGIEIWNDVFMEYYKNEKGKYNPAKQKNVDTGMGVERTLAILNGLKDNYLTECFFPIIKQTEKISKKKYEQESCKPKMRIIADHIKASCFIIADGIVPSNLEQGYILRRLIRRTIRYGKELGLKKFLKEIAEPVFEIYPDYEHLQKNKKFILDELEKEEVRFEKTLEKGLNIFNKIVKKDKKQISGKHAFLLYQSYGFPIEMTQELAKEKKLKVDVRRFEKEQKIHQTKSRTATEGKFKSGLADKSEQTTKLHTATHLLLSALRNVFKDKNIIQKGSNITPERLRFDFTFPRKLTELEIKKVEDLVNEIIQKKIPIKRAEMLFKEAQKKNIFGTFENRYGKKVSVYSIGNFSEEICAGPHVKNTSELGKFKIIKEESSSAGVRRIKAILKK